MPKSTLFKVLPYLNIIYYDVAYRCFIAAVFIKIAMFYYSMSFPLLNCVQDLGLFLIFTCFVPLIRKISFKVTYLLFINLFVSNVICGQSLYFEYFAEFFSASNINQIFQITSIGRSITYRAGSNFLYFIDIPFALIFLLFYKKSCIQKQKVNGKHIIFIFFLGCFLNLNFLSGIVYADDNPTKSIYDRKVVVYYYGLFNYHVLDLWLYAKSTISRSTVDPKDIVELDHFLSDIRKQKNQNKVFHGVARNNNLIIIQIESLQNFLLNKKYNGKEVTPVLNKLLSKGIYFNNIYDQTGAGNSSDATFLANASLYPTKRGPVSFLFPNNRFDTLPKLLGEKGYTSAVFHAYSKTYWNHGELDKALGFKKTYYDTSFALRDIIGWGISDKEFFSQSFAKLSLIEQPFYIFFRTLTSHDPFDYVSGEQDDFPTNGVTVGGQYLRSMHYVDSAIGELLNDLEKSGLLKKSLIVIYGDHRARLPDEVFSKEDDSEKWKIPVIIFSPLLKKPCQVSKLGGLIDITPTVSNLLGISTAGKLFLGKDLMQEGNNHVILDGERFLSYDRSMDSTKAKKIYQFSNLVVEKDLLAAKETIQKKVPNKNLMRKEAHNGNQ